MLYKDPNPCTECLVNPMCNNRCEKKTKWNGRENSFWIPWKIVIGMICVITMCFCFFVTSIFCKYNLIDPEVVKMFDPFPADEMEFY